MRYISTRIEINICSRFAILKHIVLYRINKCMKAQGSIFLGIKEVEL